MIRRKKYLLEQVFCFFEDLGVAVMQPTLEGFNAVRHLHHHLIGYLANDLARLGVAHCDNRAAQSTVDTDVKVSTAVFHHVVETLHGVFNGMGQLLSLIHI